MHGGSKWTHPPHSEPSASLLQPKPYSQGENLGKPTPLHASLLLLLLLAPGLCAGSPRGGGMGWVPGPQLLEEMGETAAGLAPRCEPAQVAGP